MDPDPDLADEGAAGCVAGVAGWRGVVGGAGAGDDVLSNLLSLLTDALSSVVVACDACSKVGRGMRRAGAEVGVGMGRRRLGGRTSKTRCWLTTTLSSWDSPLMLILGTLSPSSLDARFAFREVE